MKVLDIINRAFRLLNVKASNEQVDGPEALDAFSVLNQMVSSWATEKLLVYNMRTDIFDLVAGTAAYTIAASGANWTAPRPTKIESAFIRDNSSGTNYDYTMTQWPNARYQESYNKSVQGAYPAYFFYNPTLPSGTITLFPTPSTAIKCGISQWNTLAQFTDISDAVALPDGYDLALGYGLAYEMALEYGKDPFQFQKQLAENKAKIKRINKEKQLMSVDSALLTNSGEFDIQSGLVV